MTCGITEVVVPDKLQQWSMTRAVDPNSIALFRRVDTIQPILITDGMANSSYFPILAISKMKRFEPHLTSRVDNIFVPCIALFT